MKQKKTIYLVCAVILMFVITAICVKSCGNDGSSDSVIDTTTYQSHVVDSVPQDTVELIKIDSTKFPDYVYSYEYIEIYEKFKPLLSAIAHVESRGTPNMVSKSGKYQGLLQQSTINVDDCNQSTDSAFKYSDRLNPKKAVQMFLITQKKYNKKMSYEMACRIWSCHDVRGVDPDAGRYWERVKKELDKHDYSPLWEN